MATGRRHSVGARPGEARGTHLRGPLRNVFCFHVVRKRQELSARVAAGPLVSPERPGLSGGSHCTSVSRTQLAGAFWAVSDGRAQALTELEVEGEGATRWLLPAAGGLRGCFALGDTR